MLQYPWKPNRDDSNLDLNICLDLCLDLDQDVVSGLDQDEIMCLYQVGVYSLNLFGEKVMSCLKHVSVLDMRMTCLYWLGVYVNITGPLSWLSSTSRKTPFEILLAKWSGKYYNLVSEVLVWKTPAWLGIYVNLTVSLSWLSSSWEYVSIANSSDCRHETPSLSW